MKIKASVIHIYRTDKCSFSRPVGTQAVIRYSEDGDRALLVAHSFENRKNMEIAIPKGYKIEKSLYNSWAKLENGKLTLSPTHDFQGNVYLLTK